VAEKPSVAKEVARILHGGSQPSSRQVAGCAIRQLLYTESLTRRLLRAARSTTPCGPFRAALLARSATCSSRPSLARLAFSDKSDAAQRLRQAPGHLQEQEFAPAWKHWQQGSEGDLIQRAKIVTLVRGNSEPLQAMLQQLSRGCQWLILWLDCDREGEAICMEARKDDTCSSSALTSLAARRSSTCAGRPTHGWS